MVILRKQILKEIEELIFMLIDRCEAQRYNSGTNTAMNPHKIRQGYINSLSSLIKAYNQLLKDTEINEVKDELEQLKEELIQ